MKLSQTAGQTNRPALTLATMFYDPLHAFRMVEQRRATWFPLLLCMLATFALMYTYYSIVDFVWLKEKMAAAMADPAKREKAMSLMTKNIIMTSSFIAGTLSIPLMAAIVGFYFMIAGKIRGTDFDFGKGFALVAWSLVPMLLATALGFVQIFLSSNGQMEFSELNPVSLNQLFFHIEMAQPWAALLDSVSIATVWQVVLLVAGFQVLAKVPRITAIIVTLLPYFIVYGIWIAVSLRSAA